MLRVATSPCLAIQRWEDAHSSLLSALTAYVDTCMNLKNSSLTELATTIEDIVPRIERHTTSLRSFVTYQLFQAGSVLSTTRNQLVSPACVLPEEILAEIFTLVIYDTIGNEQQPLDRSVEGDLRTIYRRLYNLMRVCTSWRSTAAHKKSFWSIVPMIDKCRCSGQPLEDVTERSLRRSGGTGLYIATNTSLPLPILLRPIVSYGAHISGLNIQTESRRTVEEVMSTLAVFCSPGVLSELSIYLKPMADRFTTPGGDEIIKLPPQHQERNNQILGSLRALRIRRASLDLIDVSFTNLVELRLEQVDLGYQPAFKRFLRAVSSSSNLQTLHLDNVTSYEGLAADAAIPTGSDLNISTFPATVSDKELLISPPNLKTVYLSGIDFKNLKTILNSFVPGSEKWILSLGVYSAWGTRVPGGNACVQEIANLISKYRVDTLSITGEGQERDWLSAIQLRTLLKAVPDLTTLRMVGWDFYREHWEALTRPEDPREAGSSGFPRIRNFHVYDARIFDERSVQAFVSSHNIRKLRLSGTLADGMYDDGGVITGGDAISVWLESNVADFCLIDRYHNISGFSMEDWCLW